MDLDSTTPLDQLTLTAEERLQRRVYARYLKTAGGPLPLGNDEPPGSPTSVTGASELPGASGAGPGKRNIPKDHPYDPRALKPLSRMLWAMSVSLGHALTAYRQFTRIKSSTISPDGQLGGRGYVMGVKEVRDKLHDACEALSAISDTIHDEINAPHWEPKMGLLNPSDAQDVKKFLQESQQILNDPEAEAEEDMDAIEDAATDAANDEDSAALPDQSEEVAETESLMGEEQQAVAPEGEEQVELQEGEEGVPAVEGEEETVPEEGAEDEGLDEDDEATIDQAWESALGQGAESTEAEEPVDEESPDEPVGDESEPEEPEPSEGDEEPVDEESPEEEEPVEEAEEPVEEAAAVEEEAIPSKKKRKKKPMTKFHPEMEALWEARTARDWKANSSIPVDTLSGPRVDHLGPAEGDGSLGSYNDEEAPVLDNWSLSDGRSESDDYIYQTPWENDTREASKRPELTVDHYRTIANLSAQGWAAERIVTSNMGKRLQLDADDVQDALMMQRRNMLAYSVVPDSTTEDTATDAWDFGLGYGARGQGAGGYNNPSGEGDGTKGVLGPTSGLPSGNVQSQTRLPTDALPPVARSDYYTEGLTDEMLASSGLPAPESVPQVFDRDLPNTSEMHERHDTPYIRYDYTTHNYRPDPNYSRPER